MFKYMPGVEPGVEDPGNCLYDLTGVIVHKGDSRCDSGHYYSYVKVNRSWFKFDDENVFEVGQHEILDRNFGGENLQDNAESTHAYMLIYAKKNL